MSDTDRVERVARAIFDADMDGVALGGIPSPLGRMASLTGVMYNCYTGDQL